MLKHIGYQINDCQNNDVIMLDDKVEINDGLNEIRQIAISFFDMTGQEEEDFPEYSTKIGEIDLLLCKDPIFENISEDEFYVRFDNYDGYAESCASKMIRTEEFKRDLVDDYDILDLNMPVFSGVLEMFYIAPEYRGCGLGKWIEENLTNIIERVYCWKIRCLSCCLPTCEKAGTYADSKNEENTELHEIMQKLGYHVMGENENYYIKDFMYKKQ